MTYLWTVRQANEAALKRIAELLALKVASGDMVALSGDLGAGKTTLARALLRALLADASADVPSPTFSIVQTYDTPRLFVAHADLYRLSSEDETSELGLDEILGRGALLVEWPGKAPSLTSVNWLDVALTETSDVAARDVAMTGHGTWAARLVRLEAIAAFLDQSGVKPGVRVSYLQGDASARAYARTELKGRSVILMDSPRQPDGPPVRDGLPYSRVAHLAEDVRPFVAIAGVLKAAQLSVPDIYHSNLERGLLLLEDFGDGVFGQELSRGAPQADLWRQGVDTLLALRNVPVPASLPLPDGSSYCLPRQDRASLQIEAELLIDWYWPAVKGTAIMDAARQDFLQIWNALFDTLLALPTGWTLRDYHSPNLISLPERSGARRAGIIDFQDALVGPAAYDLVSLLQDARVDVAAALEHELLHYYCEKAAASQSTFDRAAFEFSYAAFGAQRNTKILGIFARLAKRDGKPGYLRHVPRLWDYLDRDLAHPDLTALKAWYGQHFPENSRHIAVKV
jgi:N-acetylmuramate 1-kinase